MASRSHGRFVPSDPQLAYDWWSDLSASRFMMAASTAPIGDGAAPRPHPTAAGWASRVRGLSPHLGKSKNLDFLEIHRLWGTAHGADDTDLVAGLQQSDDSAELFRGLVRRHPIPPDFEDDMTSGNRLGG